MKEVIYIQAGEISNYTGTHFWNTQESYLSNGEPGDAEIEPDVSFCESVDAQERSTLYPRLLVFDRKSNFGTLVSERLLEDEAPEAQGLWTNGLVEYRQEPISQSTYQRQMDEEGNTSNTPDQPLHLSGDVRYWSDFSRVYYLPRSLQKLPDLPDWEESALGWNQGHEQFKRFDEETELMDGAVRLCVENCDNLQGIQIMNDTTTFGGFMASFFTSFRDEYLKLPSFTMPLMSGAISQNTSGYDANTTKKLINEAFYLRTLNEFSSMNVPMQDPTVWPSFVAEDFPSYTPGSVYHRSAILSAHVESCTLPFRMKKSPQTMASVCGLLNWRNTCPFGELSGAFPINSIFSLDHRIFNFSSNAATKTLRPYAQLNVTRGLSERQIDSYAKWSMEHQSSRLTSIASIHALGYPIPSSFPPIRQDHSERKAALPTAAVLSSVSASPDIAKSLKGYALVIENCVKRRPALLSSIDISLDDLRDLANDLQAMHDNALEHNPDDTN